MRKKNEESIESVLEEVTFILNEIRNEKLKVLGKKKLTPSQEEIVEDIERDLEVCVTKLGLLLHPSEL